MGAVTPLDIVVTGAGGYLGRALVAAAQARGHQVTPIYRSGNVRIAQDLAMPGAADALVAKIPRADAVIHAASEMTGDWATHARSSLPAMRAVCAFCTALTAHLVHISSIAVYDFEALATGGTVTENSPLITAPWDRDSYARAKAAQEKIVADLNPAASVLRVGAIYGPGRFMNTHLGIGLGPVLLRLAATGQVPMAHLSLVARVALEAAETKAQRTVNVLDSDLPDRNRYIAALKASGWPKLVIPFPWQILSGIGAALPFWQARPGLLRRRVLHARMKPLRYDNGLMRRQFSETPSPGFETLMKQAITNA